MSEKENIQSAQAFFDHFNARNMQAIDAQHAPGYTTAYAPGAAGPLNEEQNRMVLQGFWTAFPDLNLEVTLQVANDQYVVSHWLASGTHTGPLYTASGGKIEPTGKKAVLAGSTTIEIQDGKHKQSWMFYDQASLLAQLGLLPGG
jgi:predicted ester cyclase